MIDALLNPILGILLLIFSLIIYIFLLSYVYPSVFLKSHYLLRDLKDRGIKKFIFDSGRAICYVPSPEIRKYMPSYILSENNNKKFLKCKLHNNINTMNYDVIVYNSLNKVIKVLEVFDRVSGQGSTHAINLPPNTSFVRIVINQINGTDTESNNITYQNKKHISLFFVASILTTIIIGFLISTSLSLLIESYRSNLILIFLESSVVGVVVSLILRLINHSKATPVIPNDEFSQEG